MTIGLQVVTKDWQDIRKYVEDLSRDYFDVVYVQINGGGAIPKDYEAGEYGVIKFSKFKWNDNFADARNALLAEVKTDYWCWMDSDDVIFQPENIRTVVEHMETAGLDLVFADYIYARNAQGLPTEVQRRERFIKTGTPGAWRGTPRVHETFIPDGSCETENTRLVTWVHQSSDQAGSAVRNERLLRMDYADTEDPRAAYYLGLCLGAQGKYAEAIPWFEKLIETGGWDEERYRAYLQIASCYQQLGQSSEAVTAYLQATTELPEWPDAYYGLQQVYYEIDDHEKSVVWFETGRSKTRPDTDSAYNPVVTEYQPLLIGALSYLFVGRIKDAVKTAGTLKRLAPDYADLAKLEPEILRAYNEEQAIGAAKTLIKYNSRYNGDPKAVLDALPPTLRADIRLTSERRTLIAGKEWPKGSVVFYCGSSFEPWGPETLDRGMGGSEEAVVYLAREMGKGNRPVTVYNERTSGYTELLGGYTVNYLPWTEVNPNDTFDTFIAERDPTVLKDITARVKICDLHDTIQPSLVYSNAQWVDLFMFKSQWHRNLYPDLPDAKCCVIGNGIKESYV